MFKRTCLAVAALCLLSGGAFAETFEVKMLNKGESGSMVFEPSFIAAQPGDTIHFVATDKGHNVESIKDMIPEGVEAFKSKMNKDFELVVEKVGAYGVKCTPHYGMGMVALIKVGDADLEAAKAVKQTGKAKARFEEIFAKAN
ncbi:pseudoazurin [Roseibium aestuarii]|uniref:Pseudoazurin n=1 Tax=Roseibium aestuarii TaxID=2600299 RepID=A0ABW4K1S5_9HYPH|nr:pseudoazurin [Roseibium aestuarii]